MLPVELSIPVNAGLKRLGNALGVLPWVRRSRRQARLTVMFRSPVAVQAGVVAAEAAVADRPTNEPVTIATVARPATPRRHVPRLSLRERFGLEPSNGCPHLVFEHPKDRRPRPPVV